MEYVVVEFGEPREVMVDGASQGKNRADSGNYNLLPVTEGLHTIELGGSQDFMPISHTVVIGGTSQINPLRVVFQKKA